MLAAKERYESGFLKQIVRTKYNFQLSERLKEARNQKGLSLSQTINALNTMGVKCGLSTLQMYETSESSLNHRYPSLIMLVALADLYECSIDYLIGRNDKIKGGKMAFKKKTPRTYSYS